MTEFESNATGWSFAFLRTLAENGVTDIVVCPGSRSQSLALLAAEFADRGLLNLHVVLDERAAGFLALGMAIESSRPAVVVTTSGSSVANLHPAVMEAFHQGTPLILVTADRPESVRLRGGGQTTFHVGMFSVAVKGSFDVPPAATPTDAERSGSEIARDALTTALRDRGPVHVNPQFIEPLSSNVPSSVLDTVVPGDLPVIVRERVTAEIAAAAGVVVVAGLGAGARAEEWARALGAPLFAEVESGAHFGPHLVTDYRTVAVHSDFAAAVTTVVVVGRPTLARVIDPLCAREDVDVFVVQVGEGVPYRPTDRARLVDDLVVTGDGDAVSREWAIPWARRSRMALDARASDPAADVEGSLAADHAARSDFARREMEIQREPVTSDMLVRAVWDATWPHDRLVFGASSLIRVADSTLPGKPIRVHSNRGLAGIDGNIATAQGIASASRDAANPAGVTRLVIGDLAAAYDASSLALLAGPIQVIVGNNNGGRIFEGLEVAATANPEHFEAVMLTPQNVNFEGLASAYGIHYRRVETRGQLTSALTETAEPILVEVVLRNG
ncbi:MAG: 2-succinyl-5-enolpyruvyl-6-hydroxy-3-cyclohexene-1-carboxylic-acid synthase [Microbacteriaceae bacterium]|nr:2-succinyl-5-enolpyruvyl-6-hydroxy-3-cyclohexene-1-carboxylic-acid synthase [Microbacteriaceae bacterium]